jgi:hypothetical protein
MKSKTSYLAAIATFVWIILGQSYAATIPAGAMLVGRTLQSISSRDQPSMPFAAELENNVTANGKVVLPAGTKLSGKIATSKRTTTSSQQLTVNLANLQFGGRTVPNRTTGAYQLESTSHQTRSGVSVSRYSYVVPSGRKMQFRLAELLTL